MNAKILTYVNERTYNYITNQEDSKYMKKKKRLFFIYYTGHS